MKRATFNREAFVASRFFAALNVPAILPDEEVREALADELATEREQCNAEMCRIIRQHEYWYTSPGIFNDPEENREDYERALRLIDEADEKGPDFSEVIYRVYLGSRDQSFAEWQTGLRLREARGAVTVADAPDYWQTCYDYWARYQAFPAPAGWRKEVRRG